MFLSKKKSNTTTPINNSMIMNISGKNVNCAEILELMKQSKIECHIEKNKSIRCEDDRCWVENGCTITASIRSKEESLKPWTVVKNIDGIECAHYWIPGKFQGCVKDWEKKSACTS